VFPVRYGLSFRPTECICVFRMVLTINTDCFLNTWKNRKTVGGVVFYAVRVVSGETRRLVLPRTLC
jgi:hypothetical protein